MKRFFCILLLLALTGICASAETELFAVNVGKGDALLLRTEDWCALVDTGKKSAYDRLEAALGELGITRLDAVFLTHCDKDHTGGLKRLLKSGIAIGSIYASAYHPKEQVHPAEEAAAGLGLEVVYLQAGDAVTAGSGTITVLAPDRLIPDSEDDNSLVLLLETEDGRMLLCGDMKDEESALLLSGGGDISCDVLKIPCHGSGEGVSEGLIAAAAPRIAVISAADAPDSYLAALLATAGCDTYVTRDSLLGVCVTLSGGEISVDLR